jgi:His-Xaa-Ser system protein HxsD
MPEVFFASSVARLSAVKKAAYRLSALCDTEIVPTDDGTRCLLRPVGQQEQTDLSALFRSTVLDYELREEISEKTAPFRDALLAVTFAPLAKPGSE